MVVAVQHDEMGIKAAVKCDEDRLVSMVLDLRHRGSMVFAVYEAGPLGFGLQRRLAAAGAYCLVARPRDLDEYHRRVKTDRRDAAALCGNLDRFLFGNDEALAPVSIPTPEEERWRAPGRERRLLARQRRREVQSFRGTCLSQGLRLDGAWSSPKQWPRVRELLPPSLQAQGERMLARVRQLEADLEIVEDELVSALPMPAPYGVGALTSALLDREIIHWERFQRRQQVASFFGLVPSEHSTGNSIRRGSITKRGNSHLRHIALEAAWRLVRFQPGYCRLHKWRPVLTDPKAGSSRRKKAIVALARHFAVDVWRIRTGRVCAAALGLIDQSPTPTPETKS
jgi:transposase